MVSGGRTPLSFIATEQLGLLFTEATTLAKAGIIILSENRAVDVIKSL